MINQPRHLKAYLALIAGILCISWSAIFVKLAHVPGETAAFYRMFGCLVLLIPIAMWKRKQFTLPAKKYLYLIIIGGICFALDLTLWHWSILSTTASVSTLLAANSAVWVGIASILILHQKLPGAFWWGLLLSFAGVVLVLRSDILHHPSFSSGNLLAIAASIVYSAYLVITGEARAKTGTLVFMTISVSVTTVFLFFSCLAAAAPLTGFSSDTWISLGGLAVVAQFGGWMTINYALGHMRPAYVSMSLLVQPVITTILASLIFQEQFHIDQIFGGVLVLCGIFLANRRKQPG
jgi:drug/metabolite transporter (DMT)-like permease